MTNDQIWEERYKSRKGIAYWPFDLIVSFVFRFFGKADDRKNIRVLDYGCGGGNNFWFLIKEGFDGYACDISNEALKITKNRLASEGLFTSKDRYAQISDTNLPYPDNYFSCIIDRESLCQSNWEDIKKIVNEFNRILKPGGCYIGINFTCFHPDIKDGTYIGNGDWTDFKSGVFQDQGQRHLFSAGDIYESFENFEILEFAHLGINSLIASSLGTSEFIVVAKKK